MIARGMSADIGNQASDGECMRADVVMDRNSGRSRGFGFMTFTTTEAADVAISVCPPPPTHSHTCTCTTASCALPFRRKFL